MSRLTWNKYFINIAQTVSTRSPDPKTQVGCVIVDQDNRIVSTGYNGSPAKYPGTKENWETEMKHTHVLHAELNAILYARTSLKDCKLYVTHKPCLNCAKLICGSGIGMVYYSNWRPDDGADELFNNCNIQLYQV